MRTLYLAGPDVFCAQAIEIGQRKKAICRQFGFEGLFPLDNTFDPVTSKVIYDANIALMQQADAGLFNLTPFRGSSADSGTLFELGFMTGLGKKVIGYSADPLSYVERVRRDFGATEASDGQMRDRHGHAIDNFGQTENLMISEALGETATQKLTTMPEQDDASPYEALAAISAFRACVEKLAQQEIR